MGSTNVQGNLRDLQAKANESRKATIRALYQSIVIEKGIPQSSAIELKKLQVISNRPIDEGFSARDFNFFKGLYSGFRNTYVAKQHEAASFIQSQLSKEGRYNPLLKQDRDRNSYMASKCSALIAAIETEETRRIHDFREQRERDEREYAEYLRTQKEQLAKHVAEVQAAEKAKREAAAARPKLQGVTLYGAGLEALAAVKVEMRKAGKFTAEHKIYKAEVIELLGSEDALKAALSSRGNDTDVLAVLTDHRQITVKKNGAVTVYGIRE